MRTLGTFARACIRWRQRPPVPIRPTLMRSLAPWAPSAGAASAAAAEVWRNERRVREERPDIRHPPVVVKRRFQARRAGGVSPRRVAQCQALAVPPGADAPGSPGL